MRQSRLLRGANAPKVAPPTPPRTGDAESNAPLPPQVAVLIAVSSGCCGFSCVVRFGQSSLELLAVDATTRPHCWLNSLFGGCWGILWGFACPKGPCFQGSSCHFPWLRATGPGSAQTQARFPLASFSCTDIIWLKKRGHYFLEKARLSAARSANPRSFPGRVQGAPSPRLNAGQCF
jgi:hypothetical protein